MNSIDDMIEAERIAYAKGDDDLSKLLLDCIQIAESQGEEAVENFNSGLSEQLTDASDKLERLQDEISGIIDDMSH